VTIRECNFSSSTGDIAVAHIQNPASGWLIAGNTFEMGSGAGVCNAVGATVQAGSGNGGVMFTGNWIADTGTGAFNQIVVNGNGWSIIGNEIAANSNASSVGVTWTAPGIWGTVIRGNTFLNVGTAVVFPAALNWIDFSGNNLTSVTNATSGTLPNSGIVQDINGNTTQYRGSLVFGADARRSTQTPTETVLVSGVNATAGEHVSVTLSAARLVGAPTNFAAGQHLYFTLIQNGTGGFAVTWNAVFKVSWSDTGNTANKRSTIGFWYDGTNWNQLVAQTPYV